MYLKRAPYTIDLAMSSLNVAATEEWSGECGKPERVEFKCTHRSEMCNNLKTEAFWENRWIYPPSSYIDCHHIKNL